MRGVPRDLQGPFKGASRLSKRSSKGVSRGFQGIFKDILRKFQGCLKKVSSVFQENFKKSFKDVCFKECLNEVLPSNFVVTRISSQLTEQKEGLFIHTELMIRVFSPISYKNHMEQQPTFCKNKDDIADSYVLL